MAPPVELMNFEQVLLLKLPTSFSSRPIAPFRVSCLAPPIGLIIEVPPSAVSCKTEPRDFHILQFLHSIMYI